MSKPPGNLLDDEQQPIVGTSDNLLPVYERFAQTGKNAELLGAALEYAGPAARIRSLFASLTQGTRILDVGPGRGDESRLAVSLGHSVTGLDFSPSMQQLYRENVPEASTILGDMTAIPEALYGKFDLVFCSFSFLHLPREKGIQALQAFKKALKQPGGDLYLITLIGQGEEELNSGRDFLKKAGIASWYFYLWEISDLLVQITQAGFQIVGAPDRFQLIPDRPDCIAIRARLI